MDPIEPFRAEPTYHWTPSCMSPVPNIKWRVLTHGNWYYIECKHEDTEAWEGGLSGTQAWLGLTDEECEKAYPKKVKPSA